MAKVPSLPNAGDVYWVDTEVLYGMDPKPDRPVLVVSVPQSENDHITVVTRTTDLAQSGAFSPASPDLRLNKPGVWSWPRIAEISMWFPPRVRWCGTVDKSELEAVIAILLSLGRLRKDML